MRIRSDEHVSREIVRMICELALSPDVEFSSSFHVGHDGSPDEYWATKFAKGGGDAILTADTDFFRKPNQVVAIEQGITKDYRDQAAKFDAQYKGQYLAGFAKVKNTPFVVVVQRRYKPAIPGGIPIVIAFAALFAVLATIAMYRRLRTRKATTEMQNSMTSHAETQSWSSS